MIEDGKSKICRVSQEGGDQGRADATIKVLKLSAEFPLACGGQVYVLFRASNE